MKLSLAMIVRNSEDHLERTIESARPLDLHEIVVVDTGSKDKTVEIAKKLGAKVSEYRGPEEDWFGLPCIYDFAAARNESFARCEGDLTLWLDADDVVMHPDAMKAAIKRWMVEGDKQAMLVRYDYERHPSGFVTMTQWRERVSRRGFMTWRRFLHEIQTPNWPGDAIREADGAFWIEHEAEWGAESQARKTIRNLWVIEHNAEKAKKRGEELETWVWKYWGHCLKDQGKHEEAIAKYNKYLNSSDWDDERCLVTTHAADSLRRLGKPVDALKLECAALADSPDDQSLWLSLMETYAVMQRWDKLLQAAKHIGVCGDLDPAIARNPTAMMARPLYLSAVALVSLNQFDKALACIESLERIAPGDEGVKHLAGFVRKGDSDKKAVATFWKVHDQYVANEQKDLADAMRKAPPKEIAELVPHDGIMFNDRPRIVFACGGTAEPWGPESLGKGIGGSEEAVILLTKELAKRGWGCEVYADVVREGVFDGVAWNPWWTLDRIGAPDVFVAWRTPLPFQFAKEAKSRWIWLHDLPVMELWPPEARKDFDGAFLLTKYHREQFSFLRDDQVILTQNGISKDWLVDPQQKFSDPLRCIYGSSPDRGLEPLLTDIWPKIVEKVPDAELHVYYGFTPTFDTVHRNHPAMMEWKTKMLKLLLATKGVKYHGRVGQMELAQAYAQSHVWLYPTPFGEISCVTAMKAQAMGAMPFTSGYAALAETQQHGWKGPADKMADAVVDYWANWDRPEQAKARREMAAWARKTFSWESVANQWHRLFLKTIRAKASPTQPQTPKILVAS